ALRDNLKELPEVVDLAAELGVDEVYLQRLVFWGEGLATRNQSVFGDTSDDFEQLVSEAERRAWRHGLSFRGTDSGSPRTSLLGGHVEHEPWRACSRPLRLAYITAQGT